MQPKAAMDPDLLFMRLPNALPGSPGRPSSIAYEFGEADLRDAAQCPLGGRVGLTAAPQRPSAIAEVSGQRLV